MRTRTNYPYDWAAATIDKIKETFKISTFNQEPYEVSLSYISLDKEAQQALSEAFDDMGWYFYKAGAWIYKIRISSEQYKQLKEEKKLDEIEGDFK